MNTRSITVSLLSLFVISLSLWSILRSGSPHINKTTALTSDAIMEDVNATIFNKQGKPSLKIISPSMIHYVENNVTEITTPKITIFREPAALWHIDSNNAQAFNGLDKIIFRDHVVVRHQDNPAQDETTMYTCSLTVYPDKKTAETSEAVSLIQPTAKISATGMLADMNEGTIKFLSQAREEYAPSS